MDIRVTKDTWLPAQTALVEVESPGDGLFVCTSARVDCWPRRLTRGLNLVRCMIREERAPITLREGEVIGEVMEVVEFGRGASPEPAAADAGAGGPASGAGKRKAGAAGQR